MATESFTREILISDPKAVKRFAEIVSNQKPLRAINRSLVSDKAIERGRRLLKQHLSR